MPSFAKKQRPQLMRMAWLSTESICRDLLKGNPARAKQVREYFKTSAQNLVSLMGDNNSSFSAGGFKSYGEWWLRNTAEYLDKPELIEGAEGTAKKGRAAAIDLLKYHLLACYFRLEADYRLSRKEPKSHAYISGISDKIDAEICRALGINNIMSLLR